jgi:hypothetical protein
VYRRPGGRARAGDRERRRRAGRRLRPLVGRPRRARGPARVAGLVRGRRDLRAGVGDRATGCPAPGVRHHPGDGEVGEGLRRARGALAAGRPGEAPGLFTALSAGWPGWAAYLAGTLAALAPAYRRLIPCQIDDHEAMGRLGVRLDAYTGINVPTVPLGGERSPPPSRRRSPRWPRRSPRPGVWCSTGRATRPTCEPPARWLAPSKRTRTRCCARLTSRGGPGRDSCLARGVRVPARGRARDSGQDVRADEREFFARPLSASLPQPDRRDGRGGRRS